jgi:hypothetical protein
MTNTSDLKHSPCRPSQRQRIFDKLDGASGQDVPASELAEISLQYCARLKELRDLGAVHGFRILNRVEHDGSKVLGYYRLLWDGTRPPAFNVSATRPPTFPPSLFGELGPERYPD